MLVARSRCSETRARRAWFASSFRSRSLTRQAVRLLARSSRKRRFCCFFERWNQSLSSSTPSSLSIRSKSRIAAIRRSNSASSILPSARSRMGSVCQAPKKMPMLPARRQRAPEPPHRRPLLAPRSLGSRERGGEQVARVHPLVEQVDGLPLAGALDAADDDQRRELLLLREVVLRVEEGGPQPLLLLLPDGRVESVVQLRILEHEESVTPHEVARFAPARECRSSRGSRPRARRTEWSCMATAVNTCGNGRRHVALARGNGWSRWAGRVGLLLGLLLPCRSAGGELLLVEDGRPRATIVVASDAPEKTRAAAAELQRYIVKITGASLTIGSDLETRKGSLVLVGRSRLTEAAHVAMPSGLSSSRRDEGFVIRCRGRPAAAGRQQRRARTTAPSTPSTTSSTAWACAGSCRASSARSCRGRRRSACAELPGPPRSPTS